MRHPVAVDAVDFIVRAVGEVGGIKLMFALDAEEALLVVGPTLGYLLLSLEHQTVAPWTDVGVSVLPLNDRHVRDVQNGLGFVAVFVGIAEVAVDLIVRALGTKT